MTTADDARREAAFLFFWLPKTKQPTPSPALTEGEDAQMSGDRCVVTCVGKTASMIADQDGAGDMLVDLYYGDAGLFGELCKKDWKIPPQETPTYVCGIDYLKKLLEPLTSDWVRFRFGPGGIFIVDGEIGEKAAAAIIAPRVDCED